MSSKIASHRTLSRRVLLSCVVAGLTGCGTADAGTPSAADLAAGKLSGLYVRQQNIPLSIGGRMTFNLIREYFYFFPDGHVVYGIPPDGQLKEHPAAADYAALSTLHAKDRGTYTVSGGQITLNHDDAGGAPQTEPFSVPTPGDDSVLQIGPPSVVGSVKAVPFKDGQAIDGVYQFDGTVGLGAANTVYNVKTLTFHPDGTLGAEQLSGVDTQGVDTGAGNSGITTHSNTAAAGTYHFNGFLLETTVAGKTEKATAFRWAGEGEATKPGMIYFAGRLFLRQDTK